MHKRWGMPTAALLILAAAGCGQEQEPTATEPTGTSTSTSTSTSEPTASTGGPTPSGTSTVAEPELAPLDWQPTGREPRTRVVIGESWTAAANESRVVFGGDEGRVTVRAGGGSVDDILLEGDTAVVSAAFGGEAQDGWAVVVDLASGEKTRIQTPPPANGPTWARDGDSVWFPARGDDDRLCLATFAVGDTNGEDGWCAPEMTGFANLTASEHGVGLMTFDNARPVSCRTPMLVDQTGTPVPFEGPTECKGWDVAATGTGAIWSEVPDEQRQEEGTFFATVDGDRLDLGAGTTGSLLPCGGDAFFVRDPQAADDTARLLRWDGTALTVAYESPSTGDAFLGDPECADGILTISAFGEEGDEQVSASVS